MKLTADGDRPSDVTVLLSASTRLVREAMCEAFEEAAGVRVVATAGDAFETISEAQRHRPAVAVLSDDIGEHEYLRASKMITELVRSCRVLLSSADVPEAAAE